MDPNEQILKTPTLSDWLLLALLGLIWGSSYILIKKGLEAFNAEQVACLRITITAVAFLPFFVRRFKIIDWSKFKYLLIVGFTGSFFPAFLFSFAQTQISSSVTGVLSSLTPIFTLILGILFFRSPVVWAKITGVVIGFLGATILLLFGKEAGIEGNLWYGLLVVLGSLLYATSSNTVAVYLKEMDAMTISAVSFVIISIPAGIYLFSTGFTEVVSSHEKGWISLGYIAILALVGTFLATVLFFKLVKLTDAVFSSFVSYLIPLVAIGWGALDGEPITIYHLGGMVLILTGVYLSRK